MPSQTLICVVDDDESVRESLPGLLNELGYVSEAFASAREFLQSKSAGATQCLILDIVMPGMSGPELQRELSLRRQKLPIIFITGTAEDCERKHVIEMGAVDCLEKPFTAQQLCAAIDKALRTSSFDGLKR
jgi:FixJ family two-component response regulator